MIHIGLFEGIGGFSLAATQMGWETLITCEINPFGQRVLKYYWPNAYHHDDIKTLNYGTINNELSNRFGAGWRNDDIIITGGFPCQPYSLAGKRLGTADDRHLWPEMLRIIRDVQPTWVVGENVFGLINWNGGLVFDEVQTDLEAEGYEVQPYVLPAASVNAPHKRDRVWFVAHRANTGPKKVQQRGENGICGHRTAPDSCLHGHELLGSGQDRSTQEQSKGDIEKRKRIRDDIRGTCEQRVTSNSESQQSEWMRFDERESCQPKQGELRGSCCEGITESNVTYTDSRRQSSKEHREKESRWITEKSISNDWENFPTQSPVCIGDDGLSSRLVDITFPRWRNESIKAMGNAIVPQVVLQIFKTIEKYYERIHLPRADHARKNHRSYL